MTNTTQKNVTINELGEILMQQTTVKGASIICNILQYTDAKLKKTNNPYKEVFKLTQMNVLLNTEYVRGVLIQLSKENKDESEYQQGTNTMPLTFGENNRFIGTFKGEYVLQYRPYDNSKPNVRYFDNSNGNELNYEDIKPFLPAKKVATNQGTEKEILWRKLYLKNLIEFKFLGTTYKVIKLG